MAAPPPLLLLRPEQHGVSESDDVSSAGSLQNAKTPCHVVFVLCPKSGVTLRDRPGNDRRVFMQNFKRWYLMSGSTDARHLFDVLQRSRGEKITKRFVFNIS